MLRVCFTMVREQVNSETTMGAWLRRRGRGSRLSLFIRPYRHSRKLSRHETMTESNRESIAFQARSHF
jgi:hypothetical protein